MDKIKQVENKLIQISEFALDYDVPVGFGTSMGGKFMIKYSLSSGGKIFSDLDSLFNEILAFELPQV